LYASIAEVGEMEHEGRPMDTPPSLLGLVGSFYILSSSARAISDSSSSPYPESNKKT